MRGSLGSQKGSELSSSYRGRRLRAVMPASSPILPVHAAVSRELNVALVGCGGRGTGATANALERSRIPLRLVAMADVSQTQLVNSHNGLRRRYERRMEVPDDHRHVGFDAYRRAIDQLDMGDIVILAAPPAFRWVHFAYAVQKGVHVFMEPPVAVDGPTCRRMMALAQESKKRNLKVAVGFMARHCQARRALLDRIRNDDIGDILHMRAYRQHGPVGSIFSGPNENNETSELLWQIERFQSFLWASGGLFNDLFIHKIDECCWMKNQWPIRAQGLGGRHYRGDKIDQNFDNYAVEYTFADGTLFTFHGRAMVGARDEYASYVHGTKGMGIVSAAGNHPARCRLFGGHSPESATVIWRSPEEEANPYELEWDRFIESIRRDLPFHELDRAISATVVACMGRKAAHTGQVVSMEEMLAHDDEFAPAIDTLTEDSPAPLQADEHGRYPVPMPGLKEGREY